MLQEPQWTNARKITSPNRANYLAAGPLRSTFVIHSLPVLIEDQTPPTHEFQVIKTPTTFASMPCIQLPVTQDNLGNTETSNYNSDHSPTMSGEIPTAQPEANEEMVEADTTTERAWNPRSVEGSQASNGKFFTRTDIMKAVLDLGTQIAGITKTVANLQTQNAQQMAVIFELRSQVQFLSQELKK